MKINLFKKKGNDLCDLNINKLLKKATQVDKEYKVFGSKRHKYKLSKCIDEQKLILIEKKYNITLPKEYRDFITTIGNGGAGPYYGIYEFDDSGDELKYASRSCRFSPQMTDEEWRELVEQYDECTEKCSDEDYDEIENKFWQGMIVIGTQGCTYEMRLIISGEYRGRVVYTDLDMVSIPFFVEEKNFIAWYKRWLKEVIKGYNIFWFGINIDGNEEQLIKRLELSKDSCEKIKIIYSFLKFKSLSENTINILSKCFSEENNIEVKGELLHIICEYNDKKERSNILKKSIQCEQGLRDKAVAIIANNYKDNYDMWYDEILNILPYINKRNNHSVYKILTNSDCFNPQDIICNFNHEDKDVRKSTIYYIGKSHIRVNYVDDFIKALNDKDPWIVHTAIQATIGLNDKKLIPVYINLYKQWYKSEKYYIRSNLEQAFKELDINIEEIRGQVMK